MKPGNKGSGKGNIPEVALTTLFSVRAIAIGNRAGGIALPVPIVLKVIRKITLHGEHVNDFHDKTAASNCIVNCARGRERREVLLIVDVAKHDGTQGGFVPAVCYLANARNTSLNMS